MSSMLTLRPGMADLSSFRQHYHSTSRGGEGRGMLHQGAYEFKDIYRGGLPTPPATTDMNAIPASNVSAAYPPVYYLPEQRPSNVQQPNQAHPTYSANTKLDDDGLSGQPQDNKVQSTKQERDSIATHLQIPDFINSSKGSLAEFAAEITCLFWFETSQTLDYAENLPEGTSSERSLNTDAVPTIGFRKWVTTILSTTQVGQNVVLLALMFIYRLKRFNPSVSGKKGSEFRLLTIALMLGNKFLDDNTYTNKTWAEVSGISVQEIHIMEVEFLSNMRYELYASRCQWKAWWVKLRKFGLFYESALRGGHSPKAVSPTTPVTQNMQHKLPSPPSGRRQKQYQGLPNPLHTLPHLPRSPVKQYLTPDFPADRKRSLDASLDLPPAKRVHSSISAIDNFSPTVYTPQSVYTPDSMTSIASYDAARTSQLTGPTLPYPPGRNGSQLTPLALPGPRVMSTIYPSTTGLSQPTTPTTLLPPNLTQMPAHNLPSSTGSRVPSQPGSAHTSPTNLYGISTPTRQGLSPSYFLMNRSSPYRPVRHVNTLLYPPPSAALHNPVKNIDHQQIHYQPLSKMPNQLLPGPMPSMYANGWQSHQTTPLSQPYHPN